MFLGGAFGVDPNAPLLRRIYASRGESARGFDISRRSVTVH